MSTDERSLQLVEQVLQGFSMQLQRIPESDTKTPDYWVADSNQSYLLEVKDKYPDEQELQRRQETLERGEVYGHQEQLTHQNSIASVIEDGYKQLRDHNDKPADFQLLWLHARGLHPDVQMSQLEATLYGTVSIIDKDRFTEQPHKPCYFFYFSAFFPYRDTLDGAIVSDEQQAKFCLNPYSPRYEALKQSTLCKAFGNGISDPPVEEAAGDAYIANWGGSRKDKKETLRLLQEKYNNPNLLDIEFTHVSGEIIVPREEE